MQTRRDQSAGVIVFHRSPDGCRFLLLRSRQTKRPLWEFPKGGVQGGESLRQAALRELAEETGLGEADVAFVDGFSRQEQYRFVAEDGGRQLAIVKRVTYFLAEARHLDVTIAPVETSRYDWFPTADARRRVRYAARRAMLDAAAQKVGCVPDDGADQSETSSRTRETS